MDAWRKQSFQDKRATKLELGHEGVGTHNKIVSFFIACAAIFWLYSQPT